MCGLIGVFKTSQGKGPLSENLLIKMRDTMIHRGPDDQGVYMSPDGTVGLGHRRLSIIDLSPQAAQPMSNQDKSLWIVFNGEIYNHLELRKKLNQEGCRFKTDHSDTEVILKGYEKWGESILDKLRGMFAFAIWDVKKKKIWLVRDRIGIKPLYYTMAGGMFIFASEIKAILSYPTIKRQCDDEAFYNFLTFLVSPAPKTLFKDIFKLPAGHTMTINHEGQIRMKRYWNPFEGGGSPSHQNGENWTEKIIEKLRESIRLRMVSDVNFGVFLSGGVDSSANVALMSELMDRPVNTFSIGFEGPEKFNELPYARKIADKFKTNHHETIIREDDLLSFLPKLVHHQDEPIVDPVCVPVYFVAKLAKDNGTTVCQVGEGADELFCGYPYWKLILSALPWAKGYQVLPSSMRKGLWSFFNGISGGHSPRLLDMARRASYGEDLFWGGAEAYQETAKKRILSSTYLNRMKGYSSYEPISKIKEDFKNDAPPGADYLQWMTYLDLRLRLPELLLMRVDKMTMAASVESRVPFLDHEFVSLSLSIPQSEKFPNGQLKYLLKKAVEPILPRDIIYRRKQGFAVPINDWFQARLRQWSDQKIMDFVKKTDYFNPEKMRSYLNGASSKMTWFLFNFAVWHQYWIEGEELDFPS